MILFRLILIVGMLAISTLAVAQEKPNIVFIMADDLGLGDVSYYNEVIQKTDAIVKTPAIDSLAEQGVWFNDAHSATSLCSPTRYCVMSGNMNYRSYAKWGVWGTFRESPFRPGEATLASVPKSAGYSTAFIGKWHLGGDFRNKKDGSIFRHHGKLRSDHSVDVSEMVGGGPASLGFDYSLTIPCGIQGPVYTVYENGKWLPANDESKLVFLTEKNAIHPKIVSDKGPGPGDSHFDTREIGKLISQKASDFIERQNGSKPFFLCYWSPHVHLPHFPTDEFDGKKIANQTPSRHLDTLLDLDQQVARIISSLKKANQFDNTLIILTSDNGGLSPKATLKSGHDPSGGYRGFKNSAFEGGHRVPYIATWPGHIQPGTFCN
ncbi:MAG: sulfatase-like hydrolase/transferase, partial [Planctomycetota bacterium]